MIKGVNSSYFNDWNFGILSRERHFWDNNIKSLSLIWQKICDCSRGKMSVKNIMICDVYENQYSRSLDDDNSDNHKNNNYYFI